MERLDRLRNLLLIAFAETPSTDLLVSDQPGRNQPAHMNRHGNLANPEFSRDQLVPHAIVG